MQDLLQEQWFQWFNVVPNIQLVIGELVCQPDEASQIRDCFGHREILYGFDLVGVWLGPLSVDDTQRTAPWFPTASWSHSL